MSAARLTSYTLKHDIVLETRDPSVIDGIRDEVLKPAGTTVFVRRPKAKDLRAFDKHGDAVMAAMIELLKRVVKLEPEEIENLDGEDFESLGELVAPGSANSPRTGQTP